MKNKKVLIIMISIILILSIVGLSYALWYFNLKQTGINKIAGSCFNLSLTNEKNDINLTDAYPITNEEGKKLTPYSFTITNTCDLFASYTVNLEVLENNTLPIKYISSMINNESIIKLSELEDAKTTIDGSVTSKILAKGSLGSGDSVDYNLRLWMSEDVTPEDTDAMNKNFKSKVVVTTSVSNYSPVEQGYNTLADAILANEYQTTPEISKQKIAAKQTPDFSKTAPLFIWNVQKSATIIEIFVKMPHPDLVALKDSDERFQNLTNDYVLLPIGTGYTFNSETGKYDLTNVQQLDPTTLTYDNTAKYYFCDAGYNTSSSDIITVYKNTSDCAIIYELTNSSYTDINATGSGGSTFKSRVYNLNGYALTQQERESDKSDKGLYQMEDNDGLSYFYRGSVNNNYAKYANTYWRIIRINGDSSVRLLYAGTKPNAIGEELLNQTDVKFNLKRDNPAYNGYMYGNTLNESYEKTTVNENDSNIKKVLDEWYKNNILGTSNENVITDSGFCNERSFYDGNGYTDTGKNTYFNTYKRYFKTKAPTLNCFQSNDLFTLSTNEKGNKALTYPIGLITVDELMLSGYTDGYINKKTFTYSSVNYWTMSTSSFNTGALASYNFFSDSKGFINGYGTVTSGFGVRPVINIKGDAKISGGIGTSSSPFEIVTD